MKAHDAIAIIEKIAETGSRFEKEALLQELAGHEFGRWVLKAAYDPFVTYGVKPKLYENSTAPNLELTMSYTKMVDDLASRKLTGNAADRELFEVMNALDPKSSRLLFLMLSKDLKCGISETTINVAVPGLVPTFSVQRANLFTSGKIKTWPWKAEPKLDGQRNTFLCKGDNGAFFTRSGKVVPALQFMVPTVLKVAKIAAAEDADIESVIRTLDDKLSFMLDGEAMMGLFAETGALRRKDQDAEGAELHLYDMMSYNDFNTPGKVGPPQEQRRERLRRFVAIAKRELGSDSMIQIVPQYFVNSDDEAMEFFQKMRSTTLASYLARGDKDREAELLLTTIDAATNKPKVLEGAMIKDPTAQYEKRKCRAWQKIKAEETEDLPIIGFYPGEPHTKYEKCLGGLIMMRDGVEVRCGGGFTDQERLDIWEGVTKDFLRISIQSDQTGFEARDGTKGTVYTGNIAAARVHGKLIEVEFHEVTPDGSLRHPRFIRFRDDKQGEKDNAEAA